jgi:hypothetical protein
MPGADGFLQGIQGQGERGRYFLGDGEAAVRNWEAGEFLTEWTEWGEVENRLEVREIFNRKT